jgi:hypothetical protein
MPYQQHSDIFANTAPSIPLWIESIIFLKNNARNTTGKYTSSWSMVASNLRSRFGGFYFSRKPTTTGKWAAIAVKLAHSATGKQHVKIVRFDISWLC